MKYFLSFCLILANCVTFAQGYQIADTSKMWNTLGIGHGGWMVYMCGGTTFHKFSQNEPGEYLTVYESQDSLISWHETGLIREDTLTQRVYYTIFDGWPEGLIYDFSLEVGDTVQVVNLLLADAEPMVCDSIDMVNINGSLKKRLFLRIAENEPGNTCEIWIESIGSNFGIMNSGYGAAGYAGGTFNLLCCSQNGNTIWMDPFWADCYIDAFYPQFVSHAYDTAYLNEYYEYYVSVDTGNAPAIELIGEYIEGFTFDPQTGKISGTPTQLGSFDCIITVKNLEYGFCTDIIYSDIVVVLRTNTSTIKDEPEKIKIYPNPFTSNLTFECPRDNIKYSLYLYTPQGSLIRECFLTSTLQADLSDLTAGVYLVKIKDEKGRLVLNERVVKL